MDNLISQFNALPDNTKMAVVGGGIFFLIVLLVLIIRVSRFEAFEPLNSMFDKYAEYPGIFDKQIVGSNGQALTFDNYYVKPHNEVKPMEKEMSEQKVESVETVQKVEPAPMEPKSSFAPAPNVSQMVEATTIEVPKMETKVPIDIGNGVSVNATIQVPAQSVDVPAQNAIVEMTPSQPTNVEISAQTVSLPAQVGVIPATIEGKTVSIPVSVPAQVVEIEAQNAIIPTIEPFRL